MSDHYKRIADMTDAEYENYMNDEYDDIEAGPRVGETTSPVERSEAEKETTYTFELTIRGTMTTADDEHERIVDLLDMVKGNRHEDDRFVIEDVLDGHEGNFWVTELVNVEVVSSVEYERQDPPSFRDDPYIEWKDEAYLNDTTLEGETPVLKGR